MEGRIRFENLRKLEEKMDTNEHDNIEHAHHACHFPIIVDLKICDRLMDMHVFGMIFT